MRLEELKQSFPPRKVAYSEEEKRILSVLNGEDVFVSEERLEELRRLFIKQQESQQKQQYLTKTLQCNLNKKQTKQTKGARCKKLSHFQPVKKWTIIIVTFCING